MEGKTILGFKNMPMLSVAIYFLKTLRHVELVVYYLVVKELQTLCHEHLKHNEVSVRWSNSLLESLASAFDEMKQIYNLDSMSNSPSVTKVHLNFNWT